jgi:hypothetical protein
MMGLMQVAHCRLLKLHYWGSNGALPRVFVPPAMTRAVWLRKEALIIAECCCDRADPSSSRKNESKKTGKRAYLVEAML